MGTNCRRFLCRVPKLPSVGRFTATAQRMTVLVALTTALSCTHPTPPVDRWTALPHAAGCRPDPDLRSLPEGPGSARPTGVRLSHDGDQRLRVDVAFLVEPQFPTRVLRTESATIDEPGSIQLEILIHPTGLPSDQLIAIDSPSPSVGMGWQAAWDYGDSPEHTTGTELPLSATVDGRLLTLVIDLSPVQGELPAAPFQADVDVSPVWNGKPGPGGVPNPVLVRGFQCQWQNVPTAVPTPRPTALPLPSAPNQAAGGSEPGMRWRFASPTGNIACDLDGTASPPTAVCELRQTDYTEPVATQCQPGWATSFTLRQGQPAEVDCYPATRYGPGLPVQQYGADLSSGAITCRLDQTTGITCRDQTSDHFFQASRQAHQHQ